MSAAPVPEDPIVKLPDLEHAQWRYMLTLPNELVPNKDEIKKQLIDAIRQDAMFPFYQQTAELLEWKTDADLAKELQDKNTKDLAALEDKIKDAEENLGESEIREAYLAKADFFCRIGDKEKAISAYRVAYDKTVALGQRLDIVFTLIRMGLFYKDSDLTTRNIEKAKTLVEEGGDWDRRNRLKTYEALYMMSSRDFKGAAKILHDTLATFSSYELFSYNTFVKYLVYMAMVSFDRVKIKSGVIDSPEVLQVLHEIPGLTEYLNSLYNSDYAQFFRSLAFLSEDIKRDRFLAPHAAFYVREMRVAAYTQLLESYSSVRLESIAQAFGVSQEFIDRELSRFIAANRLHCKIDKVGGVVETTRPDAKNAQYQATIKQGDLLLNRIQKLSRVIHV
eukprot:TRINITY_DN1294_c0_g1_i1.p1 TRINITY_DN1294_c0_g1~~TRINITY_DN1294_c0_g1_i1.p1  ORF type:complete len:401 (+),score=113.75 TRINITY_DN1294_c0_g1_i1:28-1203(+)